VEVLVQLPSEENVAQVSSLLDLAFAPTTYAWRLQDDGEWVMNDGANHLQEVLIERQRRPRLVP
jgi:polyphosphate kinase